MYTNLINFPKFQFLIEFVSIKRISGRNKVDRTFVKVFPINNF